MASAAGTMSKKAASKAAGKVVEKTAEAAQKIADALAKPEDPRPEELIARLKKERKVRARSEATSIND